MRIIPAPERDSAQRYRAEIADALTYADHVLAQRISSDERRRAARRLKDRACALQALIEQSSEAALAGLMEEPVSPLAYELALLRGSAPTPRPLSFVKADPMALPPAHRGCTSERDAFRDGRTLLFLGEHPNMPGHGAAHDPSTGRLFVGVHLNELVELDDDA